MQLPYGAPTGGVYFGPNEPAYSQHSKEVKEKCTQIVLRLKERMGQSLDLSNDQSASKQSSGRTSSCTRLDSLKKADENRHASPNSKVRERRDDSVTSAKGSTTCARRKHDKSHLEDASHRTKQLPVAARQKRKSSSTSDLSALCDAGLPGDFTSAEQLAVTDTSKKLHDDTNSKETAGEGPDDLAVVDAAVNADDE